MDNEQENPRTHGEEAPIGQPLRRARENLNLSYEDVERDTNIRARYLEAMEREDYDALPGTVYAQGFLKTYANYLNLDGDAMVQRLKSRQGVPREQPASRDPYQRREPGSPPRSARSSARGSARRRSSRRRAFPMAAVGGLVLALLVLVIGIGGLYAIGQRVIQASDEPGAEAPANPEPASNSAQENNDSNGSGGQQDQPEEPPENEAPGNNAASQENEQTPPPEEPETATPPEPETLTMVVRVDGNISWLNIQVDGEVVYEQVAEPGFVQTFEAEEKITVWSGNAGAVFLEVNGQDYGPLGESGETKLQDFELKAPEERQDQ